MSLLMANVAALAAADILTALIDGGSTAGVLDIRTGAQPGDVDAAATGTLLATLTMSRPPFATAVDNSPGGRMVANAISSSTILATGVAGYFRVRSTGIGAQTLVEGSVGINGEDLNFNTVNFSVGIPISISSLIWILPE